MPLATSPTTGIFPLYLLPSIPFRRRSSASTASSGIAGPSSLSASPAERAPAPYLSGSQSLLRCTKCYAQICPTASIISKGFNGRHGRAYLVAPPSHSLGTMTPSEETQTPRHHQAGNLPNTHVHKPTPRLLVTGPHTVSDISCVLCGTVLGWKYVDAEEEAQKYKVGMFILETKRVCRACDWENGNADQQILSEGSSRKPQHERKDSGISFDDDDLAPIEFDSEDEDECEDLFMGLWTPALAKKRRNAKAWKDEKDIV